MGGADRDGPAGGGGATARGGPRRRRSGWGFRLASLAVAGAIFLALAAYMRAMEARILAAPAVYDQLDSAGELRQLAEVAEAVRELKLVTVEIRTRVAATAAHESWRGDVAARVEAPVRLLYGADLSDLSVHAIAYSPIAGAYLVRIPAPARIATEVIAGQEQFEVQQGWLRLRSRAGEYHLGLARRALHEQARELVLSPEDARQVREMTREQVEELVRRIVGGRAVVQVVFQDQSP